MRYRAGNKTVTTTVHGGKRDAEKGLRRRLVAVDRGDTIKQTKLTTGAWLDKWLMIVKAEISPAVDLQMIGSNVAQVMRRPMPQDDVAPEMTVLSPEQSAELLNAARDSGLFAPILLALSTGYRRGRQRR